MDFMNYKKKFDFIVSYSALKLVTKPIPFNTKD